MILRFSAEAVRDPAATTNSKKPTERHDVGKAQQSDHDPAREARCNIRLPLRRGGRLGRVRVEGEEETTSGRPLRDRLRRWVLGALGCCCVSSTSASEEA